MARLGQWDLCIYPNFERKIIAGMSNKGRQSRVRYQKSDNSKSNLMQSRFIACIQTLRNHIWLSKHLIQKESKQDLGTD